MKARTVAIAAIAVLMSTGLVACQGTNGTTASDGASTVPAADVKLVYITGDMPYFGLTDGGDLTGVDGDLLKTVQTKLNVHFTPNLSDFPGFLAGIQSGRYDIGVGGVAWTKDRAKTGLFTDPVYYSPITMLCKRGTAPTTVGDLEGLSVGAVTSTLQDSALRADAKIDAHSYPSSQTGLQDLISGRIDCVSLDAFTVADLHSKRPDLKDFEVTTIKSPTDSEVAANGDLANFRPYQVAWYLDNGSKSLVAKLNKLIDSWYVDGYSGKVLKKWGIDNPTALLTAIPSFSTDRQGADRPANWTAPTVAK